MLSTLATRQNHLGASKTPVSGRTPRHASLFALWSSPAISHQSASGTAKVQARVGNRLPSVFAATLGNSANLYFMKVYM